MLSGTTQRTGYSTGNISDGSVGIQKAFISLFDVIKLRDVTPYSDGSRSLSVVFFFFWHGFLFGIYLYIDRNVLRLADLSSENPKTRLDVSCSRNTFSLVT